VHGLTLTVFSIVLKARQIGFSTLASCIFVLVNMFFRPDRFVVMLSRTEREAVKLLSKSKYGFKFIPSVDERTWTSAGYGASTQNDV
jgi:hypothetical protein